MPRFRWRIHEKFPRRPWCPKIQTAADVRYRERPRMFALTLLVAQSTLVLSSFVRLGGYVRYNRREKTGGQLSQVNLSGPTRGTEHNAIRQRLTCKD